MIRTETRFSRRLLCFIYVVLAQIRSTTFGHALLCRTKSYVLYVCIFLESLRTKADTWKTLNGGSVSGNVVNRSCFHSTVHKMMFVSNDL